MKEPKTAKRHGLLFILDRSREIMHVKWQDATVKVNHASKTNLPTPSIHVVQELMWMAFVIFPGGYILSNLIESMVLKICYN